MADTPTDRGQPNRYMVLSDGETWEPLKGSKIIEIADHLDGDDIDAAIKARCKDSDPEEGAGITVLYTAHGYEPGLSPDQPLSGAVGVVEAAPQPDGEIVGERRTIVVQFLGEKGSLTDPESGVADLMARADTDDLVMDVAAEKLEPLDGPTLARFAREAGSEPGFFQLTGDGAPIDADDI